jgi:hypothetical protein
MEDEFNCDICGEERPRLRRCSWCGQHCCTYCLGSDSSLCFECENEIDDGGKGDDEHETVGGV